MWPLNNKQYIFAEDNSNSCCRDALLNECKLNWSQFCKTDWRVTVEQHESLALLKGSNMQHLTHSPLIHALFHLAVFSALFFHAIWNLFLLLVFFTHIPCLNSLFIFLLSTSISPIRPHAGLCWGSKLLGPIWARFSQHLLADSPPSLAHCLYSWPLNHITDIQCH